MHGVRWLNASICGSVQEGLPGAMLHGARPDDSGCRSELPCTLWFGGRRSISSFVDKAGCAAVTIAKDRARSSSGHATVLSEDGVLPSARPRLRMSLAFDRSPVLERPRRESFTRSRRRLSRTGLEPARPLPHEGPAAVCIGRWQVISDAFEPGRSSDDRVETHREMNAEPGLRYAFADASASLDVSI